MQNLDKPELGGLEYQVERLLKSLKQLESENESLKQQLITAKREAEKLTHKNQQAANRIDQVITKLTEDME